MPRSFRRPVHRLLATLLLAFLLSLLGACAGEGGDEADQNADTTAAKDAGDAAAKDTDRKKGDKDTKTLAVPVEVALVHRLPLSASYSGTASLQAPNEAQVVAKTIAVLLELHAE